MYRQGIILILTIALANSQLLTLSKSGDVGVNFGGYHASAGLGGILNGDGTGGGLHAEAGTPFGQAAGAGLRGDVNGDGGSGGALYAGATSGVHHSAGAGLVVEKSAVPAVPVHKYVSVGASAPVPEKIEVVPGPQKAVFEKHVQVISSNKPQAVIAEPAPVETVETFPVYKTVYRRPHHHRRKYVYYNARPESSEQVVPVPAVTKTKVLYADAAPVYVPAPPPHVVYGGTVAVNKNGNFFNDIFNIPISTLKAVNQLVNNIVGGATVSVTKHVGATGTVAGSANGHVAGSANGHGSATVPASTGIIGLKGIAASGSAEIHKSS